VAGSVAVNRKGARVGKGGGYSDLEYAIGREVGAIDGKTTTATTIHPLQLVDEDLPVTPHDFFLDLIVTREEVIRPARRRQPKGILPDHLSDEHRKGIPTLAGLGSWNLQGVRRASPGRRGSGPSRSSSDRGR